jgi:ATP-dependent helicase/nuclease subunit A
MVESGFRVRKKGPQGREELPCGYGDFAVLERTYSNQGARETQFRHFGIPDSTDRPAGLFTDAPINDLRAFLRLLVYPEDRIAYASLIKSPFMNLSDEVLGLCLLHPEKAPFDESLEGLLPEGERELYREAGERYRRLAAEAPSLPVTALITRLWYDEGYRYETLWSSQAQVYGELYDLFFELARETDEKGRSLADFLDYLEDLISKEEKVDDMELMTEGGGGVRILSIHRSKGLEFPVVFIFNGAGQARGRHGLDLLSRHEKWGLSFRLPWAEELQDVGGEGKGGKESPSGASGGDNYFILLQKQEDKLKSTAELRRLLYVAMTRAESALFFCAALNGGSPEDPWDEETIRERLLAEAEAATERKGGSLLDLLLPTIGGILEAGGEPSGGRGGRGDSISPEGLSKDRLSGDTPFFRIEAIPALRRKELQGLYQAREREISLGEAAARARPLYEAATVEEVPGLPALPIPASALFEEPAIPSTKGPTPDSRPPTPGSEDSLAKILKPADLDEKDFGSLVHAYLEGKLNGRPPAIPGRIWSKLLEHERQRALILGEAERMSEGFIASSLGRMSLEDSRREVEFSLLTLVEGTPVTGRIDLLFEGEGAIHLVDFKTDRVEDPPRHEGQMAVYARAIGDIFPGKPVRAWLFYLRTARRVEVTDRLPGIDIERKVHEYKNLDH